MRRTKRQRTALHSEFERGTWARIGGFAGERPFRIPHREAKRGRNRSGSPHRCEAILWDLRLSVGRCEGLRRQIAQVQQQRGFQRMAKFTYDGLSEVGKRSERDVKTICAIKAWSVPSRHLPGDWRKVPGAVRCLCRATAGGVLIPRAGGQQRCHSTEAHQTSKP